MMEEIQAITYRGSLKSCNYSCSYCPFAKREMDVEEIEMDKKHLEKFCKQLHKTAFREPIDVFFTPYGEAMIHLHYQQAMIKLSQQAFIRRIGCQTNLSFSAERFLERLTKQQAFLEKIVLWATFHPQMSTVDEFVEAVRKISSKIQISVGVVGDSAAMEQIEELREKLPLHIYMWVNQMDKMKRRYTEEEKQFFGAIDPLFAWELKRHTDSVCDGGTKHLFVRANGDFFPCNRNAQQIGNFYETKKEQTFLPCAGKKCDCYLSYSHLESFKETTFLKGQSLLRTPQRLTIEALFLDVDGTLLGEKGELSKQTERALAYIAQKVPIYLATELPYPVALRKCKKIIPLLSGGCFAGGAHYVDFGTKQEVFIDLPRFKSDIQGTYIKCYEHDGKPYRIILPKKLAEGCEDILRHSEIDQVWQGGRVSIVRKGVTKVRGVYELCQMVGINQEKIMCVGNSIQDLKMLQHAGYSVAVPSSADRVKEAADYVLEVRQLPYIL